MNLALFDFDGTITTRESFGGFIRMAVPPSRWKWGRLLLAPWVLGYRLGLISGIRVRARIVHFAFRDVREQDVRDAGRRFAQEVVPSMLRAQAMERIQWHRDRGDRVLVVSGAFDSYLLPWCAEHGLDLICSELEAVDGMLTGRYLGAQCVGAEKVRRVLADHPLDAFDAVYAYGDTAEDLDLLSIAQHRYYRWQPMH